MKNKHSLLLFIVTFIYLASLICSFMIDNIEYSNAIIMLLITSLIIFMYVIKFKNIAIIILIAFILRLIMASFYTLVGDPDPDGYGYRAILWSQDGFISTFKHFQTGAYIYSWIVSIFYSIFGISETMIRILNAFLSTIVVVHVYYLANSLYSSRKIAIYAAWIIALFPSLIRFSSSFASRETLILYLTTLFLMLMYKFYITNRMVYVVLTIPIFLIAIPLHSSMFVLVIMLLCIWIYKTNFNYGKIKTSREKIKGVLYSFIGLIGIGVFLLFFFILIRNGIGTEKLYLGTGQQGLEKIAWIQESSAIGRAAYLQGLTFSNPILTLLFTPIRMLFFLYTPFIWMLRTPIDLLGFFDAMLYLYLSFKSIQTYKLLKKKNVNFYIKVLYLVLVLLIAIFAIGTSNYGTALRHRGKLVPIFVLIAVPAMVRKIKSKKGNKSFSVLEVNDGK